MNVLSIDKGVLEFSHSVHEDTAKRRVVLCYFTVLVGKNLLLFC